MLVGFSVNFLHHIRKSKEYSNVMAMTGSLRWRRHFANMTATSPSPDSSGLSNKTFPRPANLSPVSVQREQTTAQNINTEAPTTLSRVPMTSVVVVWITQERTTTVFSSSRRPTSSTTTIISETTSTLVASSTTAEPTSSTLVSSRLATSSTTSASITSSASR